MLVLKRLHVSAGERHRQVTLFCSSCQLDINYIVQCHGIEKSVSQTWIHNSK